MIRDARIFPTGSENIRSAQIGEEWTCFMTLERIPFHKAHGLGNDFLIIDLNSVSMASDDVLSHLAKRMCDRHRGVGADGVAFIGQGTDYPQFDFSIRFFNSDGSEPEMSGNGIRCAAAVHHWKAPESSKETVVGSAVGPRILKLVQRQGAKFTYRAEMGIPKFNAEEIPFVWEGLLEANHLAKDRRVVGVPLRAGDRTFEITAMFVGNPQCIILVEDLDSFEWQRYGRILESHPRFPRKTNVEFVRVVDQHKVEIRIWERGAGHTESSGTGSIASALGAILNGRASSAITVVTEGGQLKVEWGGDDQAVFLTGDAEVICEGIFVCPDGI